MKTIVGGRCKYVGHPVVCQQCCTEEAFRSSIGVTDCPHGRHEMGLGDLVALVATPIARALKLPCVDPKTNQLRPDSGCAKRKAWLNGKG